MVADESEPEEPTPFIEDEDERQWFEHQFRLADLGPFLDESRRRREERSRTPPAEGK